VREPTQRGIEAAGPRAQEVVQQLIDAMQAGDHVTLGFLCKEMHRDPNLLLVVISGLTASVIQLATGPLATPEQVGMPPDHKPEAWHIGVLDQMQAAAGERDVNTFAQIAVDAEMRAFLQDIADRGGELPDVETFMRAFMVMDRVSLTAVAAEQMRRLLRAEMDKDG
jgi:hypothetical protein